MQYLLLTEDFCFSSPCSVVAFFRLISFFVGLVRLPTERLSSSQSVTCQQCMDWQPSLSVRVCEKSCQLTLRSQFQRVELFGNTFLVFYWESVLDSQLFGGRDVESQLLLSENSASLLYGLSP